MSTMTNPTDPAPAPRGPAVRQFTIRLYSETAAARFDTLVAARGGKTGAALDAVFIAGLDALAPAAPAAPDSELNHTLIQPDAIANKRLEQPAEATDSGVNQDLIQSDSAPASRLGIALGGLGLAVAVAALAVALYRTPALVPPAAPAPAPDLSHLATKTDLAKVKADLDLDLNSLGELIRDIQQVNRQQSSRLDKLSPATPSTPGR